MALLQISEPGQTAASCRKLAVGIDLGTTNTLVATVKSGSAQTLKDPQGSALIPSVVQYAKHGEIIVGLHAQAKAEIDSANTISSVKRMLGRSLSDLKAQYPHLPYHMHASEQGLPIIETRQGNKNPIEISTDILLAAKKRATESFADELDAVVITVPAYFDDAQRLGTKEAAKLAGLTVLRLLNEPTAAAIAYGLDSQQEGIIAVYDLGGGTFDISILHLAKGVFEVLATGGNSALGGDDFDHLIANWISEQAKLDTLCGDEQRQLLNAAIAAKVALSEQNSVKIDVLGWQGELQRTDFETLIAPLVNQTLLACKRALKDAKISRQEVQNIVMVGGSTRVPFVREKVREFFQRLPLTSIDPDEVVALGAAIQADILAGNKPDSDMLLLDVIPLSLGIETMGGLIEKIIPRNTTIPIARAQEFTTYKDGQTAMRVHVVQGEREMVKDCRSLATFSLKNIPPMKAGAAHVRVTYQVDADGLLSVTALEKSTRVQATVQVKPSYGLSDDEIASMIKASFTHAKQDKETRFLAEQKVEADRLIESLLVALAADGDLLLTFEERQQILDKMETLIKLRNAKDAVAIEQAIKVLDKACQEFAARRMNKSIQEALKGHSIDEV